MNLQETLSKMIPGIMDERMLKIGCKHGTVLSTESDKIGAGAIFREEGVAWDSVESLDLEFHGIMLITNLWHFKNLKILNLSNNQIEEISGLDALVNLRKLDVSFNHLSRLKGLDALVNLENLSLFENRIEKLENLDHLAKLRIFSFGNNKLSSLNSVLYLRKFRGLRGLTLKGNPISLLPNYDAYVISHLEQIKFLDYRYIDAAEREDALDRNRIAVETLCNEERRQREAFGKVLEAEEASRAEKAAFIDGIMAPESLLAYFGVPDQVGRKRPLSQSDDFADAFGPKIGKMFFTFWESAKKILEKISDAAVKEHRKREGEVADIRECVKKLDAEGQRESMKLIDAFKADFKGNLADVEGIVATCASMKEKKMQKKKAVSEGPSQPAGGSSRSKGGRQTSRTSATSEIGDGEDDDRMSIVGDAERLSELVGQVLALTLGSCRELERGLLALELRAEEEISDAIDKFRDDLRVSGVALVDLVRADFKELFGLVEECEKEVRTANASEAEDGADFLPLMCDLAVAERNQEEAVKNLADRVQAWEADIFEELTGEADSRHRKRTAEVVRVVASQEEEVQAVKARFEEQQRRPQPDASLRSDARGPFSRNPSSDRRAPR